MRKTLALLCLCAALAGCGSAIPRPSPSLPGGYTPPTRPTATPQPVPQAQVLRAPGLEGVIGASAAALFEQFGQPRIDLAEGDVRKLQFGGPACVLDIFLYPTAGGDEQRATHVEARRASDGQDVDRAACIEALRQR